MLRINPVLFICLLFSSLCAVQPASSLPLNLSKSSTVMEVPRQKRAFKSSMIKPPLFAQNILIAIDPGHGGHDAGTQSDSIPRYQEKSFNLATAQFVKGFLIQRGYQVFMTRESDTFISLAKRAEMANAKKPSLFVSIHYNSAPSAAANGVEVFFYQSKEMKARTQKSKQLAHTILKQVIAFTKAKSRGVKPGNYAVIRETNMPAVLVEGGFVTNEEELQNLKDPTYLKKLAWGIVRGIEDFLNKKD